MPAALLSPNGLRLAALVAFLATRAWLLSLDTLPRTDLVVYAHYARESLQARAQGLPLYEFHRRLTAKRAAAHPENPSLAAAWRYQIEYPPLAVSWMTAVARVRGLTPTDPQFLAKYVHAYRVALAALDALVFAAIAAGTAARRRRDELAALAVYVAGVPLLGYLAYDRLDLAIGASVLLGAACLAAGRAVPALVALGIGALLKLVPATLLPLWLAALAPSAAWPALLRSALPRAFAFATGVALVLVGYASVDGAGAFDFVLAQSGRDVEIGSLAATVLLALGALGAPLRTVYAQGSISLATPWLAVLGPLLLLAQAASLLTVFLLFVRVRRSRPGDASERAGDLVLASVASLLLVILTAKVFSPQYLLWLLPLLPWLVRSGAGSARDAWAFLAVASLTTLIWPVLFQEHVIGSVRAHGPTPELTGPTLLGAGLLAARNLLCVAWAVALIRRLARRGAPALVSE